MNKKDVSPTIHDNDLVLENSHSDTTSKDDELRNDLIKFLRIAKNADGDLQLIPTLDDLVNYFKQYGLQERIDALQTIKNQAGWYSQQFNKKARDSGEEDTLVRLSVIEAAITALKDKENE